MGVEPLFIKSHMPCGQRRAHGLPHHPHRLLAIGEREVAVGVGRAEGRGGVEGRAGVAPRRGDGAPSAEFVTRESRRKSSSKRK